MGTAGRVFVVVTLGWILFVGHSAAVQAHVLAGRNAVRRAQEGGGEARDELQRGRELLERARSMGLFESAQLEGSLAAASVQLGDDEAAERHYRRAAELAPDFAHARLAIARSAMARQEWSEALGHLQAAVKHEPEIPGGHTDLADVLSMLGRSGDAVTALDVLIDRRPHNVSFQVTRGLMVAHDGRVDEAVEYLRELSVAHPADASTHDMYGRVLATAGRSEEALTALRQSLKIAPGRADVHYMCARLCLLLGRLSELATHLEEACRLAPLEPSYVAAWARMVVQAGSVDATIEMLKPLATGDRANRFRLLHLYRASGREDDAAVLAPEFE